jgi:carotenoid 1,2-hydratase
MAGGHRSAARGRAAGSRGCIWRGAARTRGRGADGGPVRAIGGGEPGRGPAFDAPVADGGYLWWYVDALSDDGRHGLTIIALIGSVFSPYYAWARRRGPTDPSTSAP